MDDDMDILDSRLLSLELCKSIRDIDVRIDELKLHISADRLPNDERRKAIVERMERLVETRFCLVYSLMDLNPIKEPVDSSNPFDRIHITYEMMRRNIK